MRTTDSLRTRFASLTFKAVLLVVALGAPLAAQTSASFASYGIGCLGSRSCQVGLSNNWTRQLAPTIAPVPRIAMMTPLVPSGTTICGVDLFMRAQTRPTTIRVDLYRVNLKVERVESGVVDLKVAGTLSPGVRVQHRCSGRQPPFDQKLAQRLKSLLRRWIEEKGSVRLIVTLRYFGINPDANLGRSDSIEQKLGKAHWVREACKVPASQVQTTVAAYRPRNIVFDFPDGATRPDDFEYDLVADVVLLEPLETPRKVFLKVGDHGDYVFAESHGDDVIVAAQHWTAHVARITTFAIPNGEAFAERPDWRLYWPIARSAMSAMVSSFVDEVMRGW